jgi:hypothetical protein
MVRRDGLEPADPAVAARELRLAGKKMEAGEQSGSRSGKYVVVALNVLD